VQLRGIHLVLLRKVSIEVLRRGFRGAYEQFSKLLYALDKLCRDDIPDILQRLLVSPQLAKRTFCPETNWIKWLSSIGMARNKKYQSERSQWFISQGRELGCDEDRRAAF
jgi:hypothetical protein